MQRMETAPLSPAWEGKTFPTMKEQQEQAMVMAGVAQTTSEQRHENSSPLSSTIYNIPAHAYLQNIAKELADLQLKVCLLSLIFKHCG